MVLRVQQTPFRRGEFWSRSYMYACVFRWLRLPLDDGTHCDRFLDTIILYPNRNHFTCITWVVSSEALPVETGWYFYDGLPGNRSARSTLIPSKNARWLGKDTLGPKSTAIYWSGLQCLIYSEYPNVEDRPVLAHPVTVRCRYNRRLKTKAQFDLFGSTGANTCQF